MAACSDETAAQIAHRIVVQHETRTVPRASPLGRLLKSEPQLHVAFEPDATLSTDGIEYTLQMTSPDKTVLYRGDRADETKDPIYK